MGGIRDHRLMLENTVSFPVSDKLVLSCRYDRLITEATLTPVAAILLPPLKNPCKLNFGADNETEHGIHDKKWALSQIHLSTVVHNRNGSCESVGY